MSLFDITTNATINPSDFATLRIDDPEQSKFYDHIRFGTGKGVTLDEKQKSKIFVTSMDISPEYAYAEVTIFNGENHCVDVLLQGYHP